mgnify:CR=1 FL=1
MRVVTTGHGVLAVDLRPARPLPVAAEPDDATARSLLARACAALESAWAGRPSPDLLELPLDWDGVGAWDRRVLEGARTLAAGEATSYGRLARQIGAPGAARAVGAALGRNRFGLFVPCHRVVAGDGSLGGYGDEPDALEIKRDLLALEGLVLPLTRLVG